MEIKRIKARIKKLRKKLNKIRGDRPKRSIAAKLEKNRKAFAVYVPSTQQMVDELLVMADIKPGETVFDIGSGDGRVVCTAAKLYGAKGIGIELNEERVGMAKALADSMGVSDLVEIRHGDASEVKDYGKADVIFTYLGIEAMQVMQDVFQQQLKPGTRLISNCFTYPDWQDKIVKENRNKILYVF